MKKIKLLKAIPHSLALLSLGLITNSAYADIVHNDDVISSFSHCIGNDCVNGENFGFDTLRLKENNLRMHFDDTSTSASFPRNDWRIIANDSANGGASYLGIEDSTAGRQVFRVEAGARANALYVDSQGDVGIGTSTPAVDLDIKTGNTPTVRLQQDGTSGFTPQTWDMAGNEANFFIRDATHGSKLPFRIRPDSATDTLELSPGEVVINEGSNDTNTRIEGNGDANLFFADAGEDRIGIGTSSPETALHISKSGNLEFRIESTSNQAAHVGLKSNSTNRRIIATNESGDNQSAIIMGDSEIRLIGISGSNNFATFDANGLAIDGSTLSVNGTNLNVPDYVFKNDYQLMPLDKLKRYIVKNEHLPEIPSESEISKKGLNITKMQMLLLKKIEEITLYTLHQNDRINELSEKLYSYEK